MSYELKCRHCDRFLQVVENSGTVHIKCSNSVCRKKREGLDTYKITFMSDLVLNGHQHSHRKPEKTTETEQV